MSRSQAVDLTNRRIPSLDARSTVFWLLITLILCGCAASETVRSTVDRGGLRVTLTLNKKSFLIGEPIYAAVTLENTGTEPLRCSHRFANPLTVKDSRGKVYKYHGPMLSYVAPPPPIQPSEIVHKNVGELLDLYGHLPELEGPHARIGLRGSFPPGTYTAQAVYHILEPSTASEETLKSNVVGFFVAKPLAEEKLAHALLERGLECKYRWNYEDAIHNLGAIVEQYPRSIYAPLALSYISAIQGGALGDWRAAHETRKGLIREYPEFPRALHHLRAIPVYYFNQKIFDEQLVRDEIKKLGEETQGTQIEKEAEEMLKEFDAGTSLFHELIKSREKLQRE